MLFDGIIPFISCKNIVKDLIMVIKEKGFCIKKKNNKQE